MQPVATGSRVSVAGGGSCNNRPDNTGGNNQTSGNSPIRVIVVSNPTYSYFTMVPESESTKEIQMRIIDIQGRVLEVREHLRAGQLVQCGNLYLPGLYLAEFMQGDVIKTVKLIKR